MAASRGDAPEARAGALTGALAGARDATLAGVERRAGAVLVGHKCVVVLVVLEVEGGTAMVVVLAGTVVVVARGTVSDCGAVGCETRASAKWGPGAEVTSTESIATTAPAVTRGAATTLVAG